MIVNGVDGAQQCLSGLGRGLRDQEPLYRLMVRVEMHLDTMRNSVPEEFDLPLRQIRAFLAHQEDLTEKPPE